MQIHLELHLLETIRWYCGVIHGQVLFQCAVKSI
jgi:hypothetical protein